jgi:hypothetical protein
MEITIKEPKLNNKAFTFTDSVRNQKLITKMMRDGYKERVDAQDNEQSEVDESKLTAEEIIDLEQKRIESQIQNWDDQLKKIDSIINVFATIFDLKGKQKEILENLSFNDLGELLAHVSVLINNPAISEETYWELMKAGESKKSQPVEG